MWHISTNEYLCQEIYEYSNIIKYLSHTGADSITDTKENGTTHVKNVENGKVIENG